MSHWNSVAHDEVMEYQESSNRIKSSKVHEYGPDPSQFSDM